MQSTIFLLLGMTLLMSDVTYGAHHDVWTENAQGPSRSKRSIVYDFQEKFTPNRVFPWMSGFPSKSEFDKLGDKLTGRMYIWETPEYEDVLAYYNARVITYPYAIVIVESVRDVQEVMVFCKQKNLMVTILSTGHSYIGRSSYNGSVQINFTKMKGINVNLGSTRSAAGEITVDSGNRWLEVYTEVGKIVDAEGKGRVIVGGSAHTVGMGGYTQGGGHSPISRSLGMAVDNLLEAKLVTVDGKVLEVSADGTKETDMNGVTTTTNDTSLYWALRGGGGGTWGAVITFTFKLYYAPDRIKLFAATWVLKTAYGTITDFGSETVKFVLKEVNNLCPQWGGYLLMNGDPVDDKGNSGTLTLYLNHYGSDSDSCADDVDSLYNYNISMNQIYRNITIFPTFLDYEVTTYDPPVVNTYIVNTFVQPSGIETPSKLDKLTQVIMNLDHYRGTCTGVMIGGAMNHPSDPTPVNPFFRSGVLSLTCGTGWDYYWTNGSYYIDLAKDMGRKLKEVGDGVYFNECDQDLANWKLQFWGSMDTYNRLIEVKNKYDPDYFLWCHNCVGSDKYPNTASGLVGNSAAFLILSAVCSVMFSF